uniref:Terminase n=1 Tax=viral metagenome TaxID=1070528 RepID=A0A6M3K7P7_9ZZZZ
MSRLITSPKWVPFTLNNKDYDKPQYVPKDFRDGAEGMIGWCEQNVHVPIYPKGEALAEWFRLGELPSDLFVDTGKSYRTIWDEQKKILRQALRMKDRRLVYNLIVFCWMRGEGKSLAACLIQLWKFFEFNKQAIMLGANSKDQVKFVHYDIMRDIILHSPNLLRYVGEKNIQEKEIHRKDGKEILAIVRSISSFSGIVSNITGFTFSEMFDMKNPRFFIQLYGSIRNVPNALGVIDSTVSEKTHILYKLYQNFTEKKTRLMFFSYRFSRLGVPDDYWNPNMDTDQLNDYKENFPFGEFEKYFQNLWEAGSFKMFSEAQIEESKYIGTNAKIMNVDELKEDIKDKIHYQNKIEDLMSKNVYKDVILDYQLKLSEIEDRLWSMDHLCNIKVNYDMDVSVPVEVLVRIGDVIETDWSIMAGCDMADPYSKTDYARSIFCCIAKGLAFSRGKYITDPAPRYMYVVLYVASIEDDSLEGIKACLSRADNEYEGLDTICMERYGSGDLENWCNERNIGFEPIYPTYSRQKEAAKELYISMNQGRFKAPTIGIPGSKKDDIMREELEMVCHVSKPGNQNGWFGSPEKFEKSGVQDDCFYAIMWSIFGGRKLTVDDFRKRSGTPFFGAIYNNPSLVANY